MAAAGMPVACWCLSRGRPVRHPLATFLQNPASVQAPDLKGADRSEGRASGSPTRGTLAVPRPCSASPRTAPVRSAGSLKVGALQARPWPPFSGPWSGVGSPLPCWAWAGSVGWRAAAGNLAQWMRPGIVGMGCRTAVPIQRRMMQGSGRPAARDRSRSRWAPVLPEIAALAHPGMAVDPGAAALNPSINASTAG